MRLLGMAVITRARAATLADRVRAEVRAELARRGVSQAELARDLERPAMWVSDRLRGVVTLTVDDLDIISEALDVDAIVFMERAMNSRPSPRRLRAETDSNRAGRPVPSSTPLITGRRPADRRPPNRPIGSTGTVRTARIT